MITLHMDTKKIIISGWYGNKNIGDEAQLSSMVSMIHRVLPDAEITVFSDDPAATISEHNVNSTYARKRGLSRLGRLWKLFEADLFILGGGELLYDTGMGADQIRWLKEIIRSKLMGTPVMYFNGGVGLIYNRMTRYYMKHVCNAMDLITVRDDQSKKNLRSLGITEPVYVGADSVFALTKQSIAGVKRFEKHNVTGKPKVGINVRPWLYMLEDIPRKSHVLCENFGGSSSDFVNFRKCIAGTIDYLKQKKGANIIFFPISFLKAKGDYDVGLLEEIAQLLSNWDSVTIIKSECTYLEMMTQMKELDLVIGMRLHALVFAAVLNIPMLAMSYDPKVSAFMELIGQKEYLLNMNDITKDVSYKKVDQLWGCRENVAKQLGEKVPKLASKSEKSAELMYALLNTKRSRTKLIFEGIMLAIKVIPCIPFNIVQRILGIIRYISPLPFWLKISLLVEALKSKIAKRPRGGM